MRTCLWLTENSKEEDAILVYDFSVVDDLMVVILHDKETDGPVACLIHKRGPDEWEIEADEMEEDRIEQLISLLKEYFSNREYAFHKALHHVL